MARHAIDRLPSDQMGSGRFLKFRAAANAAHDGLERPSGAAAQKARRCEWSLHGKACRLHQKTLLRVFRNGLGASEKKREEKGRANESGQVSGSRALLMGSRVKKTRRVALVDLLTVAFSRQRSKWWCCSSKMSSSRSQPCSPSACSPSRPSPDSWASSRDSTARFFDRNAAPDVAFASRIRASRAFCCVEPKSKIVKP